MPKFANVGEIQVDLGSSGPFVVMLIYEMVLHGFWANGELRVTDVFGEKLYRATQDFQTARSHKKVDGRIGYVTLADLLSDARERYVENGGSDDGFDTLILELANDPENVLVNQDDPVPGSGPDDGA